MICYTVVGATQTGKTTFVKTKILPKYPNVLVYDVQNQYSELPFWKRQKTGKYRISPTDMDFEKFVLLGQAVTGFLFVYEEASQFLEGRIDKPMKANLTGKAHTHNRFLFFFHSFSMIPPRIIDYTDYLVQFRTGVADLEGVQKKGKTKEIVQCYERLEELPRFSKFVHKVSNLAKENKF